MSVSLYDISVGSFVPMLTSLAEILDKAAEQAPAKGLDAAKFVDGRLAPDMYPLTKQVQIACTQALEAAARLAGNPPPALANAERGLDDLKALIASTLEKLKAVKPADLEGGEARTIIIPLPDMGIRFEMSGLEYLRDWVLPHFYFHVVTAYDILRHMGVEIGKKDYMSGVGRYIKPVQ